VETAQQRACTSVSAGFQKAFSPEGKPVVEQCPEQHAQCVLSLPALKRTDTRRLIRAVLDILKGNADQLFQLKQEVVADKQVGDMRTVSRAGTST